MLAHLVEAETRVHHPVGALIGLRPKIDVARRRGELSSPAVDDRPEAIAPGRCLDNLRDGVVADQRVLGRRAELLEQVRDVDVGRNATSVSDAVSADRPTGRFITQFPTEVPITASGSRAASGPQPRS